MKHQVISGIAFEPRGVVWHSVSPEGITLSPQEGQWQAAAGGIVGLLAPTREEALRSLNSYIIMHQLELEVLLREAGEWNRALTTLHLQTESGETFSDCLKNNLKRHHPNTTK